MRFLQVNNDALKLFWGNLQTSAKLDTNVKIQSLMFTENYIISCPSLISFPDFDKLTQEEQRRE